MEPYRNDLENDRERINEHSSTSGKAKLLCLKFGLKEMVKFVIICLIVVAAIITFSVTQGKQNSTLESLASPEKLTGQEASGYAIELEIASKQDYRDCRGSQLKQSFGDFDYALLGYNVFKGFPLAVGHDPGFTLPIFKADYSAGHQSADCRFSIPKGFVIIPDISCITSFTSTTIQNKYELSKALSVYTKVSVKGWGAKFSASTGYKRSSSVMSSSESVFILSTATCKYYFSKLLTDGPPNFDDAFVGWVHKLDKTDTDQELYFKFFDTFGTHFAKEVTFGARYTYEYKMSSNYYESERKSGVDVQVLASFKGFFGLGKIKTEFKMSSSQEQKVQKFSENVETRTVTVGAPPPENGSALVWASEVKANPVPTTYELVSIEELFTDKYMNTLGVNFVRINKNILKYKIEYCLYLLKNGMIESCENIAAGIELANTRLHGQYREEPASSIADCVDMCLQEITCEAITFCTTCPKNNIDYNTCHLLKKGDKPLTARKTEAPGFLWQSNIFPEKIDTEFNLTNVGVIGVVRGFETEEDKGADLQKCRQLCINDAYCSVYSYCNCTGQVSGCKMYGKELIVGLQTEANVNTFFISDRLDSEIYKSSTPASN